MIVSHDSGFLDAVCTDIIHYHNRQLRRYKGNLSHFVEAVPAAKVGAVHSGGMLEQGWRLHRGLGTEGLTWMCRTSIR